MLNVLCRKHPFQIPALKEGVLIIGASDYLEGISAEKMVFQKYG
jgi:hypothetical protein